MLIIGLVGERRSGKDTVCEILQKISGEKFERAAFADELKRQVAKIFGISIDKLNAIKALPPVRHLLQWYGTDYVRYLEGENYWVDQLQLLLHQSNASCWIITDVRFQNEANWVKKFPHHVLFRVVRETVAKEALADSHASETELKSIDTDFIINNSGDLCDLNVAVCAAYKQVVLPKLIVMQSTH